MPTINMAKPGRNDPCPCNSGIKYKYCCISRQPRPRIVKTGSPCPDCGSETTVDLSDNFINLFAKSRIPLLNFFKDIDLYFFGTGITVAEMIEFEKMLRSNTLTKDFLIKTYIRKLNKGTTLFYFEDATKMHPAFLSRIKILKDAVEAHFQGKYTLSVPVLFMQIEGLLREYGGLKLADKFKPTVSTEIWNSRFLFMISDDAEYFNAFITKLFEGQKDASSFNRNPILHGMNVTYDSQEWSTVLLLTILELRNFLWFENHTQSLFPNGI